MGVLTKSKKWKLAELRGHPKQAAAFGDVSEAELAILVESMRKDGLRYPIEILPDGTIICGHQRVRAAKKLGWTEIAVVIRSDLASAGPQAVENHLIMDNFARRQLTPLAKARCICRLLELETGWQAASVGYILRERLKNRIGKQMGLSSRSINRYLLVLEAPIAVQTAFDRGEITLNNAGKVCRLSKTVLLEISQRLDKGEPAREVIGDCLARVVPSRRKANDSINQSFGRLTRAISRELPTITGHTDQIDAARLIYSQSLLKRLRELINDLITEEEEHREHKARQGNRKTSSRSGNTPRALKQKLTPFKNVAKRFERDVEDDIKAAETDKDSWLDEFDV
jgi:ParB-like chromosome segregation protein Spo0J